MIIIENNNVTSSDKRQAIVLLTDKSKRLCIEIDTETKSVLFSKLINAEEDLAAKDFFVQTDKVSFISCSPAFTLVPQELNSKENNEIIAAFNFEKPSTFQLYQAQSLDKKIQIVFQDRLEEAINRSIFPINGIQHIAQVLISYVSKKMEDIMLLLVFNNTLFVTLQLNQKLQLCAAYEIKNTEEVLYYTMLVVQEYQLDPSTITVSHAGDFEQKPTLEKELCLYFVHTNALMYNDIKDARYSGVIKLIIT